MKVISWNVNSIRVRHDRVLGVLERHDPDVLCVQETKVTDDVFPREAFEEAGWHVSVHGQKTYNGVALFSKEPAEDVEANFPGNPVDDQARVISGTFGGVRVIDLYVINGKEVGSEHFERKMAWLKALHEWIDGAHSPSDELCIVGDFNIAPEDRDCHDPEKWAGKVHCSEIEREWLRGFMDWGLADVFRDHHEEDELFSWWDYRMGAFQRGWGLRIDLVLATESLRKRCTGSEIDREERKVGMHESKPSDHAPVIATFD